MSPQGSNVHAIVWRAPHTTVPQALTEALARQGISSEEATGPYEAFSRLVASRAVPHAGRVLLLVEPEGLPEQDSVRRAVERYDASARCWAFGEAQSPKLGPLPPAQRAPEAAESHPEPPRPVVRPLGDRVARREPPRLRLRGTEAANAEPVKSGESSGHGDEQIGSDAAHSPRSLLTTEELEMLLADDPPGKG
jgi:hypothetical protein